jgi:hypothetical protein
VTNKQDESEEHMDDIEETGIARIGGEFRFKVER